MPVHVKRPRDCGCASLGGIQVERPTVEPVWEVQCEPLPFRCGPFSLGEVSFKALSLLSNPFVVEPALKLPLARAAAEHCRAIVISAVPVGQRFATMRFDRGALRYAARFGDRYVVDLQGSFAEYLKKFSKKARGNLQRTVKKFVEGSRDAADVREYRSPSEITAFRDIAVAISHASYKRELSLGFQEGERFARQLEIEAEEGRVRGYVLMSGGEPAAYVFCRIDHDVIVYKHIGYDERFAQRSPGTALLYLILERLFEESEFRLLDFDGTEYYPYKEFFATRTVHCARMVWFRPRIREIALFGTHWGLTAAWRLGSMLRRSFRHGRRGWVSARPRIRARR